MVLAIFKKQEKDTEMFRHQHLASSDQKKKMGYSIVDIALNLHMKKMKKIVHLICALLVLTAYLHSLIAFIV